jgi:hypothetical protein
VTQHSLVLLLVRDDHEILTHVGHNLICSGLHHLVVVPRPKLGERRQSGNPHPDLEMLITSQLRELGVPIWVSRSPVRRRKVVGRASRWFVGVLLVFVVPRNSLVCKVVRLT